MKTTKKIISLLLTVLLLLSVVPLAVSASDTTPSAAELVGEDFVDPVNNWKVYDRLINRIRFETDTAKRADLMHQAEDILMASGALMPLYYYNDVFLVQDYVSGMYATAYGNKYFHKVELGNGSDTMNINLATEPYTLDPTLNSSIDGACLSIASFAGLYTYTADGTTAPDLATGYEVSALDEYDCVTYTVTLKNNLKWSDGSKLTAEDFEYSWKRAASSDTWADYGYMFASFVGYPDNLAVSALNDTTLEFTLNAPCAYIEDLLAFPIFFPVQQASVESGDDWCSDAGFVSNGPFVCTQWKHNEYMVYTKNPYYHNANEVKLDALRFVLSGDEGELYADYAAGNLDFVDIVSAAAPKKEVQSVENLGTYYLSFNVTSDLFAGKTAEQAACMRLALNMILNRTEICEVIDMDTQLVASSFIPKGMADGNGGLFKATYEDNSYYDADGINTDKDATLSRAREYLIAAGYQFDDDGTLSTATPLTIDYITNDGAGHVDIAESVKRSAAQLGIVINVQQMEWNEFLNSRYDGEYDIARNGWVADFNDPINMLEMWFTESGNNDCHFGRNVGWEYEEETDTNYTLTETAPGEGIVSDVHPGTNMATFRENFVASEVIVFDQDGEELELGKAIGTGCEVLLRDQDGNEVGCYTVVVTADVDGDGDATAGDARFALRLSVDLEPTLNDAQKTAADADTAEGISAADARLILRVAVGLDKLPGA